MPDAFGVDQTTTEFVCAGCDARPSDKTEAIYHVRYTKHTVKASFELLPNSDLQ